MARILRNKYEGSRKPEKRHMQVPRLSFVICKVPRYSVLGGENLLRGGFGLLEVGDLHETVPDAE